MSNLKYLDVEMGEADVIRTKMNTGTQATIELAGSGSMHIANLSSVKEITMYACEEMAVKICQKKGYTTITVDPETGKITKKFKRW